MSEDAWYVVCFVAFVLVFGIFVSALSTGDNSTTVERTGDDCYLIVHKERNVWFTPGENHTTRGIYCREK